MPFLSRVLTKKSHSRRTAAVEVLPWLQYVYRRLSATVRTDRPQLASPWLQRQDLTRQAETMHPAEHLPAGSRRYKPEDELDIRHDRAPAGASPAHSPCPTRQLWKKTLSCLLTCLYLAQGRVHNLHVFLPLCSFIFL